MVEANLSALEALVKRLEVAVARQEALAAGGQGAAGPSGPGACALALSWKATFEPQIEDLRAKTTALDNTYVTDLTTRFIQLVIMQG